MPILLLAGALSLAGCGYKVRSAVGKLPNDIQSLAVPTFKNTSPNMKLEQRATGALLKELSLRTRIPVSSDPAGTEAVLLGEIRSVSSSPVTFGTDAFGSAFQITVQLSVKLVRTKDSVILWEESNFLYRERYVLNGNVTDFFSEENPALDRLARDLAASLVSTLLKH